MFYPWVMCVLTLRITEVFGCYCNDFMTSGESMISQMGAQTPLFDRNFIKMKKNGLERDRPIRPDILTLYLRPVLS